ncbi:MAG: hypothetical protein WAO88_02570 [Roseicyclus sp.]|uniref:hypothetical protein n=1 Tax=Roseicyclus sp. TaxID=1914329 RepID=UPI003BB1C0C3
MVATRRGCAAGGRGCVPTLRNAGAAGALGAITTGRGATTVAVGVRSVGAARTVLGAVAVAAPPMIVTPG